VREELGQNNLCSGNILRQQSGRIMKKLKYTCLHITTLSEEQWQSYAKGWLQLKLPGDSFCLFLRCWLAALLDKKSNHVPAVLGCLKCFRSRKDSWRAAAFNLQVCIFKNHFAHLQCKNGLTRAITVAQLSVTALHLPSSKSNFSNARCPLPKMNIPNLGSS